MKSEPGVAELAGLDGAFVFTELMMQRIWLRGRFLRGAALTQDGRAVVVRHPGRWNRQGGPDFLGARLRLGPEEVEGDVELHLREGDWALHGHARDPAYGGVVLHVVLFPPREACWTAGVGGVPLPVLTLLPLLPTDLEELAIDDAAEELAGRAGDGDLGDLLALPPPECIQVLDTHARLRWSGKRAHAAARLGLLGFEGACHHGALECLGYRRNRGPMLELAARHPLAEWASGALEPGALLGEPGLDWHTGAARPANHPHPRLAQYAAWAAAVPDWPERLLFLADEWLRQARVLAVGEGLSPLASPLPPPGLPLLPTRGRGGPTLAPPGPTGYPTRTPTGNATGTHTGPPTGSSTSTPTGSPTRPSTGTPTGTPTGQILLARARARTRRLWNQVLCGGVLAGPRFDAFVCDVCLPLLAAARPADEALLRDFWLGWYAGDVAGTHLPHLKRLLGADALVQYSCNGVQQGYLGWRLARQNVISA